MMPDLDELETLRSRWLTLDHEGLVFFLARLADGRRRRGARKAQAGVLRNMRRSRIYRRPERLPLLHLPGRSPAPELRLRGHLMNFIYCPSCEPEKKGLIALLCVACRGKWKLCAVPGCDRPAAKDLEMCESCVLKLADRILAEGKTNA